MDIKQAKEEIRRAVLAYTERTPDGALCMPLVHQRPLLLMGPPGVGKTAVFYQLAQELGRDPTPAEIAKEMGISESKVREIIKIAQEPVSLETPIGEEEDSHLGDFIEDENAPAPAEVASNAMMREQLQEVLHTLTPREEKVIRLRFGLEDGQAHTLEEVGKEFNVTRERIRQIEAKALRKIRHPGRSKKLRDYYTE